MSLDNALLILGGFVYTKPPCASTNVTLSPVSPHDGRVVVRKSMRVYEERRNEWRRE